MRSLPSIFTTFVLIVFGVTCLLAISESGQTNSGINEFWKELRNMSQAEFINKYVKAQPDKSSYSQREDIADIQQGIALEKRKTSNSQREELADILQGNAPEKHAVRSVSDQAVPCYPMNVSVEVPVDPDPAVVRVPPCTVLPRCGGCCGSVPVIKCLPSSTSTVPVTVFRGDFNGEKPSFSVETLSMEVHTACSCACSIKPSDCSTDIHNYDSSTCSCQCKNTDQANSCRSPKIWNRALCRCVCQHLLNCLEDEVFNYQICRCEGRANLNQRASPERISASSDQHMCRPGFTATVVSGARVCQPNSLPSNPRSVHIGDAGDEEFRKGKTV